jgi:MFS family permease
MAVGVVMAVSVIILFFTIKENKLRKEREELEIAEGLVEDDETVNENAGKKLPKDVFRSLCFILTSVAFWFIAYNAVTTAFSRYAVEVWGLEGGGYADCLLVATVAAIISYIPIGSIASNIGRKKTIMAGVVMLTTAFAAASFLRSGSSVLLMNVLFCLAGIGWATINVNSFPMVVEMCSGGDIGKYTGFYYPASMSAQIVTPMLSGMLMDEMGMTVLFPYAAVFAALAFMTMAFVKHGDAKPEAKKALEAMDTED